MRVGSNSGVERFRRARDSGCQRENKEFLPAHCLRSVIDNYLIIEILKTVFRIRFILIRIRGSVLLFFYQKYFFFLQKMIFSLLWANYLCVITKV